MCEIHDGNASSEPNDAVQSRFINRRRFFITLGGIGGLVGTGALGWRELRTLAGRVIEPSRGVALQSVTRKTRALGTRITLTALHARRETAANALDAAVEEMMRVDEVLSIYRTQSELYRLNRDCSLHDPHPYLTDVLRTAREVAERSNGAFDITVQPLWELYARTAQVESLSGSRAIAEARRHVDWRKVHVSAMRVSFDSPGMAATLNGIAQGYAADRALAVLREHGIEHALVNTGELGALGSNAARKPWQVGIQHPRHEDAYIALAALQDRCLSTSGDYATTFTKDYAHHHIFDPKTGDSPRELSSVSVLAPSGTDADALSTAVFVLGVKRGLDLIHDLPNTDVLLVKKDGAMLATPGFPRVACAACATPCPASVTGGACIASAEVPVARRIV